MSTLKLSLWFLIVLHTEIRHDQSKFYLEQSELTEPSYKQNFKGILWFGFKLPVIQQNNHLLYLVSQTGTVITFQFLLYSVLLFWKKNNLFWFYRTKYYRVSQKPPYPYHNFRATAHVVRISLSTFWHGWGFSPSL